jgi:two-component system cell cycle sensor histidine kinase PleC
VAGRGGTGLRVSVADGGIGIPPHVISRLMRPFEPPRLQSGQIQGTGLGLAISRTLTGLHGGGIAIESEFGDVSSFTLRVSFAGPKRAPGQIRPRQRLIG